MGIVWISGPVDILEDTKGRNQDVAADPESDRGPRLLEEIVGGLARRTVAERFIMGGNGRKDTVGPPRDLVPPLGLTDLDSPRCDRAQRLAEEVAGGGVPVRRNTDGTSINRDGASHQSGGKVVPVFPETAVENIRRGSGIRPRLHHPLRGAIGTEVDGTLDPINK